MNNDTNTSDEGASPYATQARDLPDTLRPASVVTEEDTETFDFSEYEHSLEEELRLDANELEELEKAAENFGKPESIGESIEKVVWEQFMLQLGVSDGETFVKTENRGLRLDLRTSAHEQNTKDFAEGKINIRNTVIDYQERYDNWQAQFQHNPDGTIKYKWDKRSKTYKSILAPNARAPYDANRPQGTKTTNMDHDISAAEIIRDAEAAAHLTQKERITFANSKENLYPLDSAANQSKGDSTVEEWLNSTRDGKKPAERFPIDEQDLRQKDEKARVAYANKKEEGVQRSKKAAKESRKAEAKRAMKRMGTSALKALILSLLKTFLKEVVKGLIAWFRAAERKISELIEKIKEAFRNFLAKLGEALIDGVKSAVGMIVSAIVGPIARALTKVWGLLKQGWRSCKEVLAYLRDPANRDKPFAEKMLRVSQIVVAGLSGVGAIALGGIFEGLLIGIPGFAIEIPLLGSIASLIGLFLGGLIAGVLGALAIRMITNAIENRQKALIRQQMIEKQNEIAQRLIQKIEEGQRVVKAMRKESQRRDVLREQAYEDNQQIVEGKKKIVTAERRELDDATTKMADEVETTHTIVAEVVQKAEQIRPLGQFQ